MNRRNKIAEFLDTISYRDLSEKAIQQDTILKSSTCLLFALVSFVLTVLNIKSHFSVMTLSTGALTVVMFIAGVLYYLRKSFAATILVALMGAFTFTYYAISGANEGFAILWIIMVPMICMLFMGFKIGFLVSLYFLFLLIVIFYTGIRETMAAHYSEIFMTRFPILYLGTFIVSTWIIFQTLKIKQQSDCMGRTDTLTKIDNRLGYNLKLSLLWSGGPIPKLHVFIFDINRLKFINDEYGHDAGDEIITAGAEILSMVFTEYDIFARMGGDEFSLIVQGELPDVENKIDLVKTKCAQWKGKKAPFLSLSTGYACGKDVSADDFQNLMAIADKKMYESKNQYYRENSIDRRRR